MAARATPPPDAASSASADGLDQHPGDDQRLSAEGVGPVAGADLTDPPDRGVKACDQTDLPHARALGGEK